MLFPAVLPLTAVVVNVWFPTPAAPILTLNFPSTVEDTAPLGIYIPIFLSPNNSKGLSKIKFILPGLFIYIPAEFWPYICNLPLFIIVTAPGFGYPAS